jgi:hypothetical protein
MGGVVCADFGMNRGIGQGNCRGAWHGHCYVQHPKDNFPVLAASDLDQSIVHDEAMEEEDPLRFKESRDGDHLMCPFQCDDCQFWNRCKRGPSAGNVYDTLRMICIRWQYWTDFGQGNDPQYTVIGEKGFAIY